MNQNGKMMNKPHSLTLRTTRTNVMERKLKDVETFTALESKEVLELPDSIEVEESDNE